MSKPELTTAELVSTIQGSLKSVQQYMSIIDVLSKDCEDNMELINSLQVVNVENVDMVSDLQKQNVENMERMSELQKKNVDNMERMKDLQKQNVKNMEGMSDLQKQNVEKRKNIEKLREDVKKQLASFDENLKKIPQTIDEHPRSSLENWFLRFRQSLPNALRTEGNSGDFPTITIDPEPGLTLSTPACLDTDSDEAIDAIERESEHTLSKTEGNSDDFPTITIDPEPELTISTPAWLDTDSPEARAAIESTPGPLTPGALKSFLDRVRLKKAPHTIALRYTKDIPYLICQLSDVQRGLGGLPADSDRRLESRLRTLIVNLLRYYKGPGAKEQGSSTPLKYLSPTNSNQANSSSSLISSPSTSYQEDLKRKSECFNTSGTPTKSSRFS